MNQTPVEQGPFHHFLPGTQSLSIGLAGCNLRCQYCQNWEISQKGPDETNNVTLDGKETLSEVRRLDCRLVTFTYTEPMVYLEYIEAVADQARSKGCRVAVCSALYVRKKPLQRIAKKVDAFCGTLKGFNEAFYEKVCGGKLAPVLDALVTIREEGKWLEVVVLVIPTLNDSRTEMRSLCDWVVKNLGKDTPLHFIRFTPSWKLTDLPATPPGVLEDCRKIALDAGLHHAYIGNLPGHEGANTYCPHCKRAVIRRLGLRVTENTLKKGKCGGCGHRIVGIWE